MYYKLYPTAAAQSHAKANLRAIPSDYGADMLGWEEATQGAECVEATKECHLGNRLSATDVARFDALDYGQDAYHNGIIYRAT